MQPQEIYKIDLKKAVPAICVGALANACMAALVKILKEEHLSSAAIITGRSFTAFLIISVYILIGKNLFEAIKTSRHGLYILRSVANTLALFLYFYALSKITLRDATLLYFTIPLFMPFVAYFWKRYKIHLSTWIGIILGFIGVVFVIHPQENFIKFASLLALLSGLFAAINQFAVRLLHVTEPTERINFYFFLYSWILAGIVLFFISMPKFSYPESFHALQISLLGILSLIYIFFLTVALKYASASFITAFLYIIVIFASLLDWIIWNIVPPWYAYVGFVFILLGVFINLYYYESPEMT